MAKSSTVNIPVRVRDSPKEIWVVPAGIGGVVKLA
jgi:hypothetical protein